MKQNGFIIIRKCDIAKCSPAKITKSKIMKTRKANLKYNDANNHLSIERKL